MLLDGYPKSYNSYLTRLSRWIRGDYQILGYLKRKSGLNKLSKYKIIDNIRRSLVEIMVILSIVILILLKIEFNVKIGLGISVMLISAVISSILEILDYIIFRKENIKKQREANLEMKEYRLSVAIDVHDFDTRVKNSSKYLEKGHKVKASIRFKGREMAHTELGKDVLLKFSEALSNVADVEQKPVLEGRNMTMILMPKKEK